MTTDRRTITITTTLHARILGFMQSARAELVKHPAQRSGDMDLALADDALSIGEMLAEADADTPISVPELPGYHTDIFIDASPSHSERLPSLPQLETVYYIGRDSFSVVNHGTRDDDGTRTLELYLEPDGTTAKGTN